jgi:hypothetical protein
MKRRYDVTWTFLKARSHAFKAERAIAFLKRRLSIALAANPRGDLNWLRHLPGILHDYNARPVQGTDVPKNSVSKRNYLSLLQKLYGTTDPEALWNLTTSANYSPRVARRLWKHEVGDKVLLSRRADYTPLGRRGAFEKPTVRGAFGPKVYTVVGRRLKNNFRLFAVPVYRLGGLDGLYYPTELKPARFATDDDDEEKEEEEEEEKT